MDPELKGPDLVWNCIKTGKGHIYYSLAGIFLCSLLMEIFVCKSWGNVIISGLACGVFADCWAHEVLH